MHTYTAQLTAWHIECSPLKHLHAPASHMALQQPRATNHSTAQVAQARATAAAAVATRTPACAAAEVRGRPRHTTAAACGAALLRHAAAAGA
jgi:hypothetical protein